MTSTVTELADFDRLSFEQVPGLDSQSTVVLTVNKRHARRIVLELSSRLSEDRAVVPLPDILPWSAWVQQMANRLAFLPESEVAHSVLDHFGAGLLWESAINDVEHNTALLDTHLAARLAIDAGRLADEWKVAVPEALETPDYQRFKEWRVRYAELLDEHQVDDANRTIEQVCLALEQHVMKASFQFVLLAGFTELTPRMCRILSALAEQGCRIYQLVALRPPAKVKRRVVAGDAFAEWQQAVGWAQMRLRENPKGRYAIVSPKLEQEVALAHRLLSCALQAPSVVEPLAFNIAVARPLGEWPLVRAAQAWLNLVADMVQDRVVPVSSAGAALLAGGCVAHDTEATNRAKLDAHWRRNRVVQVTLPGFSQDLANSAPVLHCAWLEAVGLFTQAPQRADATFWAGAIRDWLTALGFPGAESLDSATFQTLEAYDRALKQFAHQASVSGKITLPVAVRLLNRLVRETLFQPQRDPASRLDVLGLLEAEGGRWDGVWVLGLTDTVLPASPKPNPLLPAVVLKAVGAPRATPERELQWAQGLFDDLTHCASEVFMSHAQREGESELRPSPFIAGWSVGEEVIVKGSSSDLSTSQQGGEKRDDLEALSDSTAPALTSDEIIKGGVRVLDDQSRNPLWAFVKYRLGASELRDYAQPAELNARGVFMHRAMELLWKQLENQQGLQTHLAMNSLQQQVVNSVQEAATAELTDYGERLRQLEIARACSVLNSWLELEQKRPDFRVVGLEKTLEWRHRELVLKMRIDRVDELEDGTLLVMDYKSGNAPVDPKPYWARARPVEVQLPLYASVLRQKEGHSESGNSMVGALVLAKLHARGVEAKGISDVACFPGVTLVEKWKWQTGDEKNWAQVMADWKQAIERVADEFVDGIAHNESWSENDLQYCDVKPFLRRFDEGGGDV